VTPLEGSGARADTWGVLLRAREKKHSPDRARDRDGDVEHRHPRARRDLPVRRACDRRSAYTSNATVVADKTMEVYRALQNKAIYLSAPRAVATMCRATRTGIPNSTSTWYSKYQGDTAAYGGVTYYNYTSPSTNSPLWVTDTTSGTGYVPDSGLVVIGSPAGLVPDPTKSVQMVVGPDGQSYPVFTYIILVKPNGTSGY